ncbi:MAG: DUF3095 domain-containing protein [Flavobacterium sp.]
MTSAVTDNFYSALPICNIRLSDLLAKEELFENIPADWHVVITDITGSTNAVGNGRHEDVNLIATGSIVTVLNIAFAADITIPFFFGGDGATFIIPPALIDGVMKALLRYRDTILQNFRLDLRAGTVPVAEIYGKGLSMRIAKYSRNAAFTMPVVLGNGLDHAEKIIKGEDYLFAGNAQEQQPDLSGMQCRWDKIPPPENKEEIVTLLIVARDFSQQSALFSKILQKTDELYGLPETRQPISISRLKLKTTFTKLGTEMRARLGRIKWLELLKNWCLMLYGRIYFNTPKGQNYLKSLVEMSDTLVIDGKINTVITGTAQQREKLQRYLDGLEAENSIIYGMHVSGASVMSCYVRDMEDGHIHFVDGSEGGYTQAAKMLKGKVAV